MGRQELWLALWLILMVTPANATDLRESNVEEAYIAGQLTAVLKRELLWEHDSYNLTVKKSVAYVRSHGDEDCAPLPRTPEFVISGLPDLHLVAATSQSQMVQMSAPRRATYSILGLPEHTEAFPVDDIFEPLIADLKQPQFFASLRDYDVQDTSGIITSARIGAVDFGEAFGLYWRDGSKPSHCNFSITDGHSIVASPYVSDKVKDPQTLCHHIARNARLHTLGVGAVSDH